VYLIGNAVTISTTITVGSPPVNTDPSTITLVVTKPDGTFDTFNSGSLTHAGTGQYTYNYLPLTSGGYRYVWTTTVPASASDGVFLVEDATTTVLTVAEAKLHLGQTGTTQYDTVIGDLIDTAVGVVEGIVGPLSPKTFSETYSGGSPVIILRHVPVLSVTSIVESWGATNYTLTNEPVGGASDQYGYDIESPKSGQIVRRTVGGYPFPFFPGMGNIAITYVAGRTSVTPKQKLAVVRQLRLLWADYQSGRTAKGNSPQQRAAGPFPSIDPGIYDLLQEDAMVPGIA
jgi:hypothetical protein